MNIFSWPTTEKSFVKDIGGFIVALFVALAFAFVPATFALFVVRERQQKSKHQQLVRGVSVVALSGPLPLLLLLSVSLALALGAVRCALCAVRCALCAVCCVLCVVCCQSSHKC